MNLLVGDEGAAQPTQSARLRAFVARLLPPGQCHMGAADSRAPDTISAASAPLIAPERPVVFDLPALLRLRDTQKHAVLAPDCLARDWAQLRDHTADRMARLVDLQDALRYCATVAVFDPTQARDLAALGGRVHLLTLPALPPPVERGQTYLLLIGHDPALAAAAQQALGAECPDLPLQYHVDAGPAPDAAIHLHIGDPGFAGAKLRPIDSHALRRPVIRMSTSGGGDVAMRVEHMRSGMVVADIPGLISAIAWLRAHPVFTEIFCQNAAALVTAFNRSTGAAILQALA